MRKTPITITIDEALVRDLHSYLPARGISSFIASATKKAIEEKKRMMMLEIEEANADEERNEELKLWDSLSEDGLNASNEY